MYGNCCVGCFKPARLFYCVDHGLAHITGDVDKARYIGKCVWSKRCRIHRRAVGCLGLLRVRPDGREWCFVVLFVTWANDMGAYFGGRAFGKRKLAPTISPGKSWEGACFGLGAGVLTGACLSSWTGFAVAEGAVVGALLAVMAQVGDLVESN